MTDPTAARFWSARSLFAPEAQAPSPLPFALAPRAPFDGAAVGRPPAPLPARPALGLKGLPAMRIPLVLDAAPLGAASAKAWAAAARGASACGSALLVSPAQAVERATVLKASNVPQVVRAAPGEALTPEAAASASAVAIALSSAAGAPAVMAQDALPGLLESARALTEYRAPVFLLAHPGRVPTRAGLQAAQGAGARALCVAEGRGPQPFPLAALVGHAAPARTLSPPLPAFPLSSSVTDGHALACALAAGSGLAASPFPLAAMLAEETATDADWKATGDRLAAALRAMWEDAQRAASAAGVPDPRDLTFDNLRATSYDAAALSGARLAGFDERLPWWVH